MSVSLIKFTQGVTIGAAGQALIGTATGIAVVVTNDNNTGVASWEIDILDVPGSSAIPIGILASNDSSSTPSASFTPDVKGSYRVRLQTWGVANRIGTPDIDIRVFSLYLDNGWIAPPAQIFPHQLPPPGSGLTNSKPDEMNFGGQSRGWAGGGSDKLLNAFIAAAGTGGGGGGVTFSAGTASNLLSSVVFSNSNGVSFGLNGSTITASYTVPSTSGLISAINFSAGTTSSNLGSVVFSNSNGVSFGLSGGTITASAAGGTGGVTSGGFFAAGNTTQNSSTTLPLASIQFNGLGAMSVGYSNGSIQMSAPAASSIVGVSGVSISTNGSTVSIWNNVNLSAGTTSNNLTNFIFSNSNGVSFGLSGSTVTASVAGGGAGSINVSGGTTSNNLTNIVFSNSNNVSFGLNGSTVTGSASFSQTVQTQNVVVPSAGTQTAASGTVVFSNSNGISFGMSGSSRITASYTVPSTAGLISAINFSAGTTSNNGTNFVFSNSNNVSFGLNGSTVTASISVPAQTNQTGGIYAVGNTTAQSSSSTFDARSLSIQGAQGVSVGWSNGSLIISGATGGGGGITNINVSAGTTSNNLSAIVFSNSNNVSFGLNGSTVTASITVPAQTAQTVGLYGLGNTTQNSSTTLDARSISFNGLGAVTVGYSNGSIQLSVPVQSAQTQNIVVPSAGTQTATSGTVVFSNSNGITFGMSGSSRITASHNGITGVNLSAGTTSNNLTNFVFSNSNGVTFGLNGSTVTASVAGGAGVTTAGFYALGNTTQNSSTTLALASLSYNGLGAMTVGYSNGSIQLSAPVQSSVVGVGGINISSNGSTVSISNYNITNFEPIPFVRTGSYAPGAGTWYFEPFLLPANLSGGRVNRLMSFAAGASVFPATSAGSFNSGTTGSRSVSYSYANSLALYTMGTGASSTRIGSFWSNTFSVGIAQSVSVSSGGGGLSVTNAGTISYVASIDAAGGYTTSSYTASTNRTTTATTMNRTAVTVGISSIINMLAGNLMMPVGFNTTLTPGAYYLGQAYSTASTTAGTNASAWAQLGIMAIDENQSSPKIWGATTTAQSLIFPGAGIYSAVSASPPSTVAFSELIIGPANRQYFNIVNSTI